MKMKQVLRSIYITIIVVGMVIGFSSMRCTYLDPTYIGFDVENKTTEKIKIASFTQGKEHSFYLPDEVWNGGFKSNCDISFVRNIYSTELYAETGEEPIDDLSMEVAMQLLIDNIDSVKIIRESDLKCVNFHYGENATKQEKFFFTEEAWKIKKESFGKYGLSSIFYEFIIDNDFFE